MNAVSAMDDRTAAAIREAIGEAAAGRLGSACAIGEQAIEDGGDAIALNAMLGMLRCRAGEFEAALKHLRPANEARPADVSIASNLLVALVESGRNEEALALASPELARADGTLTIARYRGYTAQLLGDSSAAAQAYEMVVAAAPDDWQSWNNLGNARLLGGDFDGAVAAFRQSLALNAAPVEPWLNLSRALTKAGRFDEAAKQLRLTAERFPADVQPLKDLHELLERRGRPDDELHEVLELALKRAPADRDLLLATGRHRFLATQLEAAEQACRAVLAADPADADAWLDLTKFREHAAPDQLPSLLEEIERAGVPSPVPDVVHAFVHRRDRRYSEGLAALESVPSDFKPWMVEDLRGQFLDKLGDHDAAFAAFARMNEVSAAEPDDPLAKAERYRSLKRAQLNLMTQDWRSSWNAAEAPPDRPAPVFLVGFPRSGTTLLDTMLMGHADVAVMEEKPVLNILSRELGGFGAIASMDDEAVKRARSRYFEGAERAGSDATRKVLIDKNPFHLMQVPLIHRLFPDARFILAIRHPADVLLSCYFSAFRRTSALSNFLRLDSAAELYDLAFTMWERSRELMAIDVNTIVYEKLVQDPEAQLRPLAEALGLDWRDELLDHTGTAASRGLIATASYAQVTEPIYRRSVGRWEKYREHLAPVLPVLRPWAEKFGYSI
jgi:tetratricopeptide (TPR) repeat protein